jgi:hypothetical protein
MQQKSHQALYKSNVYFINILLRNLLYISCSERKKNHKDEIIEIIILSWPTCSDLETSDWVSSKSLLWLR